MTATTKAPVVSEVSADIFNVQNIRDMLDEQGCMSSLDFLNVVINPARAMAGESSLRHRVFVPRIEAELQAEGVAQKFCATTSQGAVRELRGYQLTLNQMLLMGMRESKRIRKAILELIDRLRETVSTQAVQLKIAQDACAAAIGGDLSKAQEVVQSRVNRLLLAGTHYTHAEVAASLGITVPKYFKAMKQAGLIGQNRNKKHIPTPTAIQNQMFTMVDGLYGTREYFMTPFGFETLCMHAQQLGLVPDDTKKGMQALMKAAVKKVSTEPEFSTF